MRKAIPSAFVLFAVAFASAALPVIALSAEGTSNAVTRWEYRVLTKDQVLDLGKKDLAAGLNTLGEEGWELVAVEPAYIFKRPRQQKKLEDLQRQVSVAESDLAAWRDRAAWSERMARKGLLSEKQAQADQQKLQDAQRAFDRAKQDLKALPTERKNVSDKDVKPR
jgi:hypothetical protein